MRAFLLVNEGDRVEDAYALWAKEHPVEASDPENVDRFVIHLLKNPNRPDEPNKWKTGPFELPPLPGLDRGRKRQKTR